jgi:hypothetical protein
MGRTAIDPADRYLAKIEQRGPNECWPWTAACFDNGYGAFRLGNRQMKAHRFGYELHNGPIPNGQFVLHHCDNPPCQNPQHWFLGTHKDNAVDRESKGRGRFRHFGPLPPHEGPGRAYGELNANARLTAQTVRAIRLAYAQGNISQQTLADTFGVTQGCVSAVIGHRTWRHVT